jgi:2,5-diamino-6-(ribosylamino)-4(3H)-pyrimidinone 5'-phosphate reductase
VTVYSQASADGRLDGFAADPTPYYRLAFRWPVDAILMGSVTAVEAGDERVDLAGALRLLAERHGVRRVRTDGGGRLTGALLAAGCVHQVALLVVPTISGSPAARPLVTLPGSVNPPDLRLVEVERLEGDHLLVRWARADVG